MVLGDVRCLDLGAHLKLDDFYPVCDDWGLVAFVEGSIEHLDCIVVKLVRETRPVEGKRHDIPEKP